MARRHYEDEPGFNPKTMGNRRSGPPPAGPAGPIGKRKSYRQMILTYMAAHDRKAPQPQYDSGVRRGHAITLAPLAAFEGDSRRKRRHS
jgi:hypothetical protein